MTHNLNGTKEYTPGQNLYNELNTTNNRNAKASTTLGIPTYKIPQAIEIISEVLSGNELTLVLQTFGLGTERRKQNVVATDLGIDPNTASKLLHQAMDKLRKPRVKAKLNALSCTVEQLFEENEKLHEALARKEARQASQYELQHRLDAALARAKTAEQKVRQLEAEKATLQRDNSRIEGMLTEARRANATLRNELARCLDQIQQTNSVVEQYNDVFAQTIDVAKRHFEASLSKIKPKTSTLALLDLTTETTKALHNRGIHTLSRLCEQDKHSLSRLRMSQKMIQEIIDKLAERGLNLRA